MLRRVSIMVLGGAVLVGLTGVGAAEPVPIEKIQSKISQLVEEVLKAQGADGDFTMQLQVTMDYPVGTTALAVLSLEHALPHLKGEQEARAREAVRKGMVYMTRTPVEPKTYSAALAISALYEESPQRYAQLISAYATMLVLSQHVEGETSGMWSYHLLFPNGEVKPSFGSVNAVLTGGGDRSNMQMAILGLYNAARAGFQVPEKTWRLAREHYLRTQFGDGGWGYIGMSSPVSPRYAMNMSAAGTISLFICEEMLTQSKHLQCVPPSKSEPIEKGLQWVATNWERAHIGYDTYGLYTLERLGIIMGRANIAGHDWYNDGAAYLTGSGHWEVFNGGPVAADCLAILFLARGLEPIIINKLERRGTTDWNNDPYDVKHLTEFISDHYQEPKQWRIVTLEAPLDLLLRTPILYISGHNKLDLSDAEKAKLKAYVAGGGTIVGQACCSKKEFDQSFRAVMKELFAGDFVKLPEGHPLFGKMGATAGAKPEVDVLAFEANQERPAVIYLPTDQCCRWQTGGSTAKQSLAVGTGIYFYVAIDCRKMFLNAPAKPEPATETPAPEKGND